MLPSNYRLIWPSGFRGDDFLEINQMTKTWWEAPMGGSVLSFLKAE
jgi:hypothetical protein